MTDNKPRPRNAAKDRKKASEGQQAERLLKNPLLNAAFDSVEEKVEKGFKDLEGTPESRERAYLMYRLLLQLRKEFEIVIRDGKSAAKLLDVEESKRGRSRSSKPERST